MRMWILEFWLGWVERGGGGGGEEGWPLDDGRGGRAEIGDLIFEMAKGARVAGNGPAPLGKGAPERFGVDWNRKTCLTCQHEAS